MANYQRRPSASEASPATTNQLEPYRPSPSASARYSATNQLEPYRPPPSGSARSSATNQLEPYRPSPGAARSSSAHQLEPYRSSPPGSTRSSTSQPSTSSVAYAASNAKSDAIYQNPYGNVIASSVIHSPKLPPGLPECPEKDVDTFIGCPIVVLLQHKDYCAVKLQAIEEGTHAIKCRNCPYQTSEPMAMLHHLARHHNRFTDTQYLCQLSNTFMGQKPVCFGVTGYDELPDGLSDFLDGIFRWDKRTQTSVIVFPCRLCPTCYLTKSDLKMHYLSHQQALLSHNQTSINQPVYICRICRQEFQDFISYYDHHMWMKLPDEVLPPSKSEMLAQTQKVPSTLSPVSPRSYTSSFQSPVPKQPRLMDHSRAMKSIPHTQASPSTSEQALNLSVGQNQVSLVDQAMMYPPYQTLSDKQLQEGNIHLTCPFCQAVYKYRHWLAMHLQNIHGVKDKRALAEALSTSYAKSAANFYVSKADNLLEGQSLSKQNKESEVIVVSSEKVEDPPAPRPDNKILQALNLVPKSHPSLDPQPVQYMNTRSSLKRKLEIRDKKLTTTEDEDEGIGELDSDAHMKPLILNMPLSVQAKVCEGDKPVMYQHSVVYSSAKIPPRGRPKKDQRQQGNLAELCDKLAKRVEHRHDRKSPTANDDGNDLSSGELVTCDICNKSFKHKNQLWGHKKTHSKIYTCRSGNDTFGAKVKSSRLGRRQNMPNFRDMANGKVAPLAEKSSVIPEKMSRNATGNSKGNKQKHKLTSSMLEKTKSPGVQMSKETKRLVKKKRKRAKKKRKTLAKVIKAYKEGISYKKMIFLKEGNNAFYPRRYFSRYCQLRRQERTRTMLADLRQAVLLQIDAATKKNIYECMKCHCFHRNQRQSLLHFRDKHLAKKQNQKIALHEEKRVKLKEPPAPIGSKTSKVIGKVFGQKSDEAKPTTEQFEIKKDDNGRNFFCCSICHKVFAFQSAVLRHLNTHRHKPSGDVPCPRCPFIAKSPLSLAAHSRVHKKLENGSHWETLQKEQAAKGSETKVYKKTLKCDQCSVVFHNLRAFRIHKSSQHKDCFPYKCNQCPACFKQPEDMYNHVEQMHSTNNVYQCESCSYSTANYTSYLKHKQGHELGHYKVKQLTDVQARKSADVMPPPAHGGIQSPKAADHNVGALDLRMTSSKDCEADENKTLQGGKGIEEEGRDIEEEGSSVETNEKEPEAMKKQKKQDEKEEEVKDVDKGNVDMEIEDGEEGEKVKQGSKSPSEDDIIKSLSVKFEKVEVTNGSDGGYFCTECNFTTNVQDSYLRHFKMRHERSEMLTCDECQFPVYDQQGLEEHMLKAHNKNVNKLACDMCQYMTSIPERMVRHKRLHKKMTLKCDQCGYCTPEKRFMIRHILTVHEQQRPFSCEKCSYTTAYKHHLKRHYRLHKQQILQCPKCVHCTLDETLMLQHIEAHENDTDNVICNICKREFANNKSLGIHKAKDHGRQSLSVEDAINDVLPGRQYRCQVSSVTTHQDTSVQLHTVSAHEGNLEVYSCKKCPFQTAHQGSITVHMMEQHTEDESEAIQDLRDVKQCAQCGFCTSKDQLGAHMKSHLEKDIYTCEKCNFQTSHLEAMERHQCEVVDVLNEAMNATQIDGKDKGNKQDVDDKQGMLQGDKHHDEPEANNIVHDLTDTCNDQHVPKEDQKPHDSESQSYDPIHSTTDVSTMQEVTGISEEEKAQDMLESSGHPSEMKIPDIKKETDADFKEKLESDGVKTSKTTSSDLTSKTTSDLDPAAADHTNKVQKNSINLQEPHQDLSSLSCQLCEDSFQTENSLKNHVKADHTRLMVNAQNPFVCVLCPYFSCSEKEARRHIGLHNYNQEFKCEYCMFSTTTASSIATHRKVHRTKQRHSTFVHKRKNVSQRVPATLIGNYASGILIDVGGTPQRRYPCKFCGDVFQVAEEWQHHERRHLMVWNVEQEDSPKQVQQTC